MYGRTDVSNLMYGKGKPLSETHKAKLSLAKTDLSNPMHGRTGENSPLYGIVRTEEHKTLISLANSKKVYVYTSDSLSNETTLFKSFDNYTEAAKYFDCSKRTLSRYVDKNKLYYKK